MRTSLGLMLGAVLAAGSGCKAALVPVACEPRLIRVSLSASDRLNPDDRGRSLPTAVAVYQLKDPSRLENASFSDLWRDPKSALQDDLLQSEELTVSPSERVARVLTQRAFATHLAVAALVRKPSGTSWRLTRSLAPGSDRVCTEKQPRLQPLELSFRLEEFEVRAVEPASAPSP